MLKSKNNEWVETRAKEAAAGLAIELDKIFNTKLTNRQELEILIALKKAYLLGCNYAGNITPPKKLNNDNLKTLSHKTGLQFAIVEKNKATNVLTGEEIPLEHLGHKQMPESGVYSLVKYTCGDDSGCEVGNHLKSCTMYSRYKCAMYLFDKRGLDVAGITTNQCLELMESMQ